MKIFYLLVFLVFEIAFSQTHTIEQITFTGCKKTDMSFLSELIISKQGSPIDSLTIQKDIIIMSRLNGTSKVNYTITYLENQTCTLLYEITENSSLIPNLSIWTTELTVAGRVGLYEYNFLGKNNTIGGYYQYNAFHSGGISFIAPFLFSTKLGLETHIQLRSTLEPIFYKNTVSNYQYTNTSFDLLGIYQFDFKNKLKFGGSYFNEKYEYVDGATHVSIPQQVNLDKQLFKLEYTHENIAYDYYLLKGFKTNLFTQFVTTTNRFQNHFLIAWNDLSYYKRIGKDGNWASRLRFGLSSNQESPFAPFSVDNNVNIRGVGNIIDRGTGVIVLNTEFRKTLIEKDWFVLQGNAFIDSGTWRNPGGSFSDFYNQNNIRVFSGVGIRVMHKRIYNAILRIDYGYGIFVKNKPLSGDAVQHPQGIVFGIGQYF